MLNVYDVFLGSAQDSGVIGHSCFFYHQRAIPGSNIYELRSRAAVMVV